MSETANRWHYSEKLGKNAECNPKATGVCGLKTDSGEEAPHYATKEEAEQALAVRMSEKYGGSTKLSRTKNELPLEISAQVSSLELAAYQSVTSDELAKKDDHYLENMVKDSDENLQLLQEAYTNTEIVDAQSALVKSEAALNYRFTLADKLGAQREQARRKGRSEILIEKSFKKNHDVLAPVYLQSFDGDEKIATVAFDELKDVSLSRLQEKAAEYEIAGKVLAEFAQHTSDRPSYFSNTERLQEDHRLQGLVTVARNNALIAQQELANRGAKPANSATIAYDHVALDDDSTDVSEEALDDRKNGLRRAVREINGNEFDADEIQEIFEEAFNVRAYSDAAERVGHHYRL